MPTCCVCHGYYDPNERIDPVTRERLEPDQCSRCKRSNTHWEKARHGGFGDLFSRMTVQALVALAPILAEFVLLIYLTVQMLWEEQVRKSELVLATSFTLLSLVLARLCFSWRFRAREDTLLRSITTVGRLSVFRIVSLAPVFAVSLAMIWVMLIWYSSHLPADQTSGFPANSITSPGVTILLVYAFLTSMAPATMLSVARRYADSFDLPQPIFLDLPRMRTVAIKEYFDKSGASPAPKDIACRELSRSASGGLVMTVNWMDGDKARKVKLECSRWAHLLKAEELSEKAY